LARERTGVAVDEDGLVLRQLAPLREHLAPFDVDGARDVILRKLSRISHVEHEQLLVVVGRNLLRHQRAAVVVDEVEVALDGIGPPCAWAAGVSAAKVARVKDRARQREFTGSPMDAKTIR
jgi:hypothetical protein